MNHQTSRQHRRRTCSCLRLPALEAARHEAAHGPSKRASIAGLTTMLAALGHQRTRAGRWAS